MCLSFSKTKNIFASGSFNGLIILWEIYKGKEWKKKEELKGHNILIFCGIIFNDTYN